MIKINLYNRLRQELVNLLIKRGGQNKGKAVHRGCGGFSMTAELFKEPAIPPFATYSVQMWSIHEGGKTVNKLLREIFITFIGKNEQEGIVLIPPNRIGWKKIHLNQTSTIYGTAYLRLSSIALLKQIIPPKDSLLYNPKVSKLAMEIFEDLIFASTPKKEVFAYCSFYKQECFFVDVEPHSDNGLYLNNNTIFWGNKIKSPATKKVPLTHPLLATIIWIAPINKNETKDNEAVSPIIDKLLLSYHP